MTNRGRSYGFDSIRTLFVMATCMIWLSLKDVNGLFATLKPQLIYDSVAGRYMNGHLISFVLLVFNIVDLSQGFSLGREYHSLDSFDGRQIVHLSLYHRRMASWRTKYMASLLSSFLHIWSLRKDKRYIAPPIPYTHSLHLMKLKVKTVIVRETSTVTCY
jgi:hypothetical protein